MLIEREAETTTLAALVHAAVDDTSGRLGIVVGGAGIGKTELLRALAATAAARTTVLHAAGGELEDDVPFGVVRELLAPLAARAGAFAAPVFTPEPTAPVDPGAAIHGLHALVTDAVAADGPLTLIVDDVQWADPLSIRALTYLARRRTALPVVLILGIRTSASARADVETLLALDADARLAPRALSPDGVAALIGRELLHQDDADLAAACHAATGGNPLLCVSLAHELRRHDTTPDPEQVAEIGGAGVAATVRRRLAARGAEATALARALAILGPSATFRRAAALAQLDAPAAEQALTALTAEQLVVDGRPPSFAHPMLRAAVLDDLGDGARARRHAEAAGLLAADGDDEAAAHHLRFAEPLGDPGAVAVLRRAATAALGRGAPETAAAHLARALEEPPPSDQRAALLYELGCAEARAGRPSAIDRLRDARDASATDPALAQRIAAELGDAEMWAGRWETSVRTLEDGIAVAPDAPGARPLHDRILRATTGSASFRVPAADRIAQLRAGAESDAPIGDAATAGFMAVELAMTTGPAARVAHFARHALHDDALLDGPHAPDGLHALTTTALAVADGGDAATAAHDRAVEHGRRHGNAMVYARATALRAYVHLRHGRPALAADDARTALDLQDGDRFNAVMLPVVAGVLIEATLALEGPRAARAIADAYTDVPVDDDAVAAQPLPLARASLALRELRPDQALQEFEVCRRWERRFGSPCPGFVPWRIPAVAAYTLLGDTVQAQALAAEARGHAEQFGAASGIGAALHATGLAERDPDRLREAAAVLATSPARLAHAAALTDLGALLRAGRALAAAREPLRAALDVAVDCGADALADRIRAELHAAGARPRRARTTGADALTPAELRAARMAADGLTNRQIAQAAFLSPRTVEMHLRNAYRKLDIERRDQLAAFAPALGTAD